MKRRTFLAALTLPALAAIAPKAFAKKELKTEKYKGTVKFYNQAKGFGFIKADIDDEDIFVHSSGLVDQIR